METKMGMLILVIILPLFAADNSAQVPLPVPPSPFMIREIQREYGFIIEKMDTVTARLDYMIRTTK